MYQNRLLLRGTSVLVRTGNGSFIELQLSVRSQQRLNVQWRLSRGICAEAAAAERGGLHGSVQLRAVLQLVGAGELGRGRSSGSVRRVGMGSRSRAGGLGEFV